MMICLICRQAEIIEKRTPVSFQRGEVIIVINNVPTRVCPRCGEAYVDEGVAAHLLHSAEGISKAGGLEDVFDYEELDLK